MHKMDFLIIGAQKSATTALYRYLQPHTEIEMPLSKEAPLFTQEVDEAGLSGFMSEHFSSKSGKLRGKATPQYMCDADVPGRIARHNPDIKLIAVLRDPIQRAWSQYRMNQRRGTESRSFDEAIVALMSPEKQAQARLGKPPMHTQSYEAEGDYYLAWGEYGRILEGYFAHFDPSQILVVFTDELQSQPELTLDRVLAFLDLPPGFRPDSLGEVVHKGGDQTLLPNELREGLKQLKAFRLIWDCVPERYRQAIRYWYEQANVRSSTREMELSPDNQRALTGLFAEDGARLAMLLGRPAPWLL